MNNRNLRRLANKTKPSANLSKAITHLMELSGSLKTAIPEAERDLGEAQAMMRDWRETVTDLRYQLDRQRAVFLRMFRDVGIMAGWQPLGLDGAISPVQFASGELIGSWFWTDLEARYGAEYDAIQFLCKVAMLGAKGVV